MERLTRFFAERPLMVSIIILAVLMTGINSVRNMHKEGFPSVSQNKIVIQTIYPGASARDVELNVTNKIEDELDEVANLKEVTSTSKENVSAIVVVADDDLDEKQFKKVYDEVGNTLAAISDLPQDIEGPTYSQVTSDDMPVIEVAVNGEKEDLRRFIPFLYDEIKQIEGVSQVKKVGFPDEEYHILVDPNSSDRAYVDLNMTSVAISTRNIEGSGGTLESYIGEKKIVAYNKYENVNDLLETNIRRNFDGEGIKLRDIATIERGYEDLKLLVRNDGQKGVSLIVKKKPNADLLNTIDALRSRVERLTTPTSVEINLLNDKSIFTRDRLKLLGGNALIGIVLVFFILTMVLGFKTAFWTAFSIPFSFLGMFLVLPEVGITLNSITLGGCVLVLGMLVDDAIVVAEQINQEREKGFNPIEAAVSAIKKVWIPVMGATFTTILAYYPISKLGGLPGKFVWIIPAVVAITLLISLFETYFLLPTHLCHGKVRPIEKKPFVIVLEGLYLKGLNSCRRFRYGVLLLFLLLLMSAVYIAKNHLNKDPFPQDASEGFTIQITQPSGISFDKASDNLQKLEEVILKLPKSELSGVSLRVGSHSKSVENERGSEANLAMIFVYLTPFSKRNRVANDIMTALKNELDPLLRSLNIQPVFELIRIGPPLGRAFEIRVSAYDDEKVMERVHEIENFAKGLDGITQVSNDRLKGKTELNLKINHDRVKELGLSVSDVLRTIRIAFDGVVVSDMIFENKSVDLRLRLNRKGRADLEYIRSLGIMNQKGSLVRLSNFINVEERPTLPEIYHVNGRRTTTVYGQIDKSIIGPAEVMDRVKTRFESNKDIQISYAGEPVENKKIFGDLAVAALIAVLGVYLVITLILNSFSQPFIVMSAIPFGVVGIIYTIWAHNMPISMFVMISTIGLSGIIVNDSIVMVFTIQSLSKEFGNSVETIIKGAVSRLRPVLLTTFTTVFGLVPTAYALGGYDPFISPMCLALAFGLLFGTVIILVLVPVLYMVGLDVNKVRRA